MKLRNALGAVVALVFGATPTASQAAHVAQSPRAEPAQPAAKPKVRIHARLFKNERAREKFCDEATAWAASIARSDRQSAKFLRRLELEIAATRNPSVFEKGRP